MKNKGFTLVEIMVASAIALIATGLLYSLLQSSSILSKKTTTLNSVQIEGRNAINHINREVSMAIAVPRMITPSPSNPNRFATIEYLVATGEGTVTVDGSSQADTLQVRMVSGSVEPGNLITIGQPDLRRMEVKAVQGQQGGGYVVTLQDTLGRLSIPRASTVIPDFVRKDQPIYVHTVRRYSVNTAGELIWNNGARTRQIASNLWGDGLFPFSINRSAGPDVLQVDFDLHEAQESVRAGHFSSSSQPHALVSNLSGNPPVVLPTPTPNPAGTAQPSVTPTPTPTTPNNGRPGGGQVGGGGPPPSLPPPAIPTPAPPPGGGDI